MKFIVDAQLPQSLSELLNALGAESIHMLDLPLKNRTGDNSIIEIAGAGGRVVVTKDNDFLRSFLLRKVPPKLLLVNTGNIANRALLNLFRANFWLLAEWFPKKDLIEMTKDRVIVHE